MAGGKTGERPEPAEEKEFLSGDHDEDDVEQASEDSFPASDPPSNTPVSHPGRPRERKP